MTDIAISVRNLSKCYRVYDDQRTRLLHAIWPLYTSGKQEIWALSDINLDIHRGDAVAIIGRNGSGKSTLLEILAGTLTATTGEVKVNGRVSALLELGSGFNLEYTGRDNVILNGLLLGLSRDEILSRFDEIEAFAEIGAAIDRPAKTYSSGMLMRLAFAVQVLCRPDILIIDEALSVGDFFFQQKCLGHIRSLCENGVTLLFVSHDMGSVRNLCSKALYLLNGKNMFFGDSKEAIRSYLSHAIVSEDKPSNAITSSLTSVPIELQSSIQGAIWRRNIDSLNNAGSERLLAVVLKDELGQPVSTVKMGSRLVLHIFFRTIPGEKGHITLAIKNKYDQIVSSTSSLCMGMLPLYSENGSYKIFEINLDCTLEAGLYSLSISFAIPTIPNRGRVEDSTGWFGPLQIDWNYESEQAPFLGMFGLPVKGNLISP